jgi:hypothetical protein
MGAWIVDISRRNGATTRDVAALKAEVKALKAEVARIRRLDRAAA